MPGVVRPVAVVDVLDDLLPPRRAEVDVDVGIGRPALVDEPLEQQVVADRLDPADPEGVGDDRAHRAAATLGRDLLLAGEPHQVPADQEELGEPGPLDHVELVGEPLDDGRGQRVIALPGAGVAQPDEVRERRLPVRHREAREAVLLEAEIDRARRRELDRGRDPLRPGAPPSAPPRRPAASPPSPRRASGTTRHRGGAGRPASRASGRGGSRSGHRPARGPRAGRSGRRWSRRPAGRARPRAPPTRPRASRRRRAGGARAR